MPLIDASYFIGEINIPNTNQVAVQENLNNLIAKREAELLTDLFGYKMYKDFEAGLLVDPIDQKWIDLSQGVEFQDSNEKFHRWRGLKNNNKQSLIANYVYYWFMRNESTQTAGVGEVATTTENSVRVSPVIKMARAWNEMVDWIWELNYFLETKADDYPDLVRRCDHYWRYINRFNI